MRDMDKDSGKPHKKLDVWKKSIELTLDIYSLTVNFPPALQKIENAADPRRKG
jgi:hypothetical protein